jgi:hypothetical protein
LQSFGDKKCTIRNQSKDINLRWTDKPKPILYQNIQILMNLKKTLFNFKHKNLLQVEKEGKNIYGFKSVLNFC